MLISINIIIKQTFKYIVNCNYLLIIRFKILNFFAKLGIGDSLVLIKNFLLSYFQLKLLSLLKLI